jgi:hypothetical protein
MPKFILKLSLQVGERLRKLPRRHFARKLSTILKMLKSSKLILKISL